ncbi:MAG: glycyl-tRNA synthetase beta chain [Porticoccus sp.]|jgi:glycyl-tRNA synthetase beta chain
MSADFLVEIGTEELPPKALLTLSNAFRDEIISRFKAEELDFGDVQTFATPRRLAVLVKNLAAQAPNKEVVFWGPPAKVAFDNDGNPTRAAEAFARKNGIAIDDLKNKVENDGKQDKLCYRALSIGGFTQSILDRVVEESLNHLPIPKRMRWGASREEFVRPIHWVVLLYAGKAWNYKVKGVNAGNASYGHRFHSTGKVTITSPDSYEDTLRDAHVIANFAERRELIRQDVTAAAANAGGVAVISDALLNEVTALNEWPVSLLGHFEERFLAVPAEALVSSMAEHQKYFHVVDNDGQLLPMFITVANIESKDPAQVINGNERVIRPRLADAAFFYETDKKTTLEVRRESLKDIVFQAKLGSVFDKTERVARLAEILAPMTGAEPALARRAAELSKSDLVSEMVGEFDDLQGTMGRYYALNDGEHAEVAEALFEQYLPRFAGDAIPVTVTGATLALADRLDTLVGIFGIGQSPTGSKDPFALRRASLGVLRIIVERGIDLDLQEVLTAAVSQHTSLGADSGTVEATSKQVLTYTLDRFRSWYEDENIPTEVFQAVAARQLSNPLDIHQRVQAVHAFNQLAEAAALAAANKRVSNILSKQVDSTIAVEVDNTLLVDSAEKALALSLAELTTEVKPLLQDRDYTEALKQLARLRQSVDQFFDDVMVMVDDDTLRNNRLALLQQLRNLFLEVADISLLAPSK